MTRAREDLVATRVALANQLRAELERFWPGPIGLFSDLDSPISLAFLERYPSPADARGLGEQRLQAFLARQRYSGGQAARAAAGQAPPRARGPRRRARDRGPPAIVLALVAALEPLVAQIKRARARRSPPPCARIPTARSSSRCSRSPSSVITAAELLAEIGDCRARYPTRDALAADAGQSRGRDRVRQTQGRRASAGRATSDCAPRSPRSPTAPATGTPGPPTSTPARSPAATTTPARSAPSAAPGAASSGAAGKTAPRTTPPATAPCSNTSPSRSPARRGPVPTSPPPSGWSAPPSPNGRPAGPSAKRLTASRHPLPALGG